MAIGILTLIIQIPGCTSLKEKRSRLKPLIARLHREFNISVAEVDHHDAWQNAVIACALVCNDPAHAQRTLQCVADWVDTSWRDVVTVDEKIEII
jgi:uncharacterized protein